VIWSSVVLYGVSNVLPLIEVATLTVHIAQHLAFLLVLAAVDLFASLILVVLGGRLDPLRHHQGFASAISRLPG
jgi:hypothetical protein